MCRIHIRLLALFSLAGTIALPAGAQTAPAIEQLQRKIEVQSIERSRWDRASPELAYHGVRSANLADDPDWILSGFATADRETVAGYLRSTEMRAANARVQRGIERETIIGRVRHKEFVILVIEAHERGGNTYRRFVPMAHTPEGWAVSNALRADPVFTTLQGSKP